jgi:RNA-binding protein
MPLSARQKSFLRGLAHHLGAVVTVAEKGLTDNVLAELEAALERHELIKVKLRGDRAARKTWIEDIARLCRAERVLAIGQIACFFRRNQEKAVIALPPQH